MNIEIPREVADAEGVPDDLDASLPSDFAFPNPRRRRSGAGVYSLATVAAAGGALGGLGVRMWWIAAFFAALAAHQLLSAWDLAVGEGEALSTAASELDFVIGHASAALRFSGWRSRPVWNVIAYSDDEPPTVRGLVLVDGVDGSLREVPYTEPIV